MSTTPARPLLHRILHTLIGSHISELRTDPGTSVGAAHAALRSSKWRTVAAQFVKAHPHCAACHKDTFWSGIFAHQVHHRFAYHMCVLLGRPDLELDPRNLVTLCQVPSMHHHLLLGHLASFESYNPELDRMIRKFKGADRAEIKSDTFFRQAVTTRPKSWAETGPNDRERMRATLDKLFPPNPVYVAMARH